MSLKPSQSYNFRFSTRDPAGTGRKDADATPSASAILNGVVDGSFELLVSNVGVGRYRIQGTIPNSYAAGSCVQIEVTATVTAITESKTVDSFQIDTARASDILARLGMPTLATIAADIQSRSSHSVADIWAALTNGFTTLGSVGKRLVDNLDTNVGSRVATSDSRLVNLDAPISTVGTLAANAILVTPANKIFTNASNQVIVGALGASAVQSFWEIQESTVFPAGSFGAKFKLWTMDATGKALISATAHTAGVTVASITDKTGYSLAATGAGSVAAIALATEGRIYDESDGTQVIEAIKAKILSLNPSFGSLTLGAISDDVAAKIERAGGILVQVKAKTDALPAVPAAKSDIPTVAQNADAVWTRSERTLTSLSAQLGDIASVVWTYTGGPRALTAFDFTVATVANNVETTIKGVTDKLATMLEEVSSVVRFKASALTQAPTSASAEPIDLDELADAVWAHDERTLTSGGTGGNGGDGASADDVWNHPDAVQLKEDVATIVAPFKVIRPGASVVVIEVPVSPDENLVPVLFDPRQSGVSKMPESAEIFFADKAPLTVGHSNEFTTVPIVFSENFAQDTDGNWYAGAWMYKTQFVKTKRGKGTGLYYMKCEELGLDQSTGTFAVLDLEEGQEAHFFGDLLQAFIESRN